MKVVEASEFMDGDTGYVCYLTRKEAIAIKSLVGVCSGPPGTTPVRQITDEIYHKLEEKHVPYQPITVGGDSIPLQGNIV